MKDKVKLFSELYTIDEFVSYYNGASRKELRDRLKTLGKNKKLSGSRANERDAITALLS